MALLRILDAISSPADLKCLTNEELDILCREIREEIVSVTSRNGGHVASSLGAVEIIVALHSLMDCPHDRIVFDVGHQAYAHKLLTGRLEGFSTLRQIGGMSGFPKPSESPYDVHPSGHASDSLSIATGLAKARDLSGDDQKIVALIGDASLAGGMAFEALNYIGQEQMPMVIVLNDNGMSISRPVGALVRHLGTLRTSQRYQETREALQEKMEEGGRMAGGLLNFGRNMKDSMKQFFVPHAMLFEQLGITCTAPVDGHDIAALRETLEAALNAKRPVLVHVVTRKGAGYTVAQNNPELFHGVGPYDAITGKVLKKPGAHPSYTQVFGEALVREARNDSDVVAITAAMKDGTGLKQFSELFPDRFFDTGITEEHAVGMAAGLATAGKKPVVAVYSTFLQRAVDQIIIDVALANLDVVFAIDRAGLVGDDGPTHHGVFDMAYLRMVPNMRIMAPSDEAELARALRTALSLGGPVALRYPRGEAEGASVPSSPEPFEVGRGVVRREGSDVAILAFGRMVSQSLQAARILEDEGIDARVVDMRWVKPIDEDAVEAAANTRLVVTVEDGVSMGGAGSAVLETMARLGLNAPILNLGLPDSFVDHGKVSELFARLGLNAEGIAAEIRKRL
ncbi:MAG: 1-deoxy-D-xylulose-5-phosphate synthase [Eggerthellaceae bacterium]|nr:1-deoxy-D-xylulose-5-phosphate synthase [Eggerthellaceae bacterium]